MGGVSGSAVASASGNDGTWWHTIYAFANPASGNQTVTFTWANASSAVVSGITASGVGSVNGGVYGQAAANNVSINIASSAGDLTASFSGDGNTGTTHSTNQTIRIASEIIAADTGPGTAGPITHTWTHTGAFACNAVGANFVAAGGGGGGGLVGAGLIDSVAMSARRLVQAQLHALHEAHLRKLRRAA
jgi:hypothetical protein